MNVLISEMIIQQAKPLLKVEDFKETLESSRVAINLVNQYVHVCRCWNETKRGGNYDVMNFFFGCDQCSIAAEPGENSWVHWTIRKSSKISEDGVTINNFLNSNALSKHCQNRKNNLFAVRFIQQRKCQGQQVANWLTIAWQIILSNLTSGSVVSIIKLRWNATEPCWKLAENQGCQTFFPMIASVVAPKK